MNFILFDVWGVEKKNNNNIYIYKLFYIIDIFYLYNNKKTQLLILKGGPWGGASIYIYIYTLIKLHIYTYYNFSAFLLSTSGFSMTFCPLLCKDSHWAATQPWHRPW